MIPVSITCFDDQIQGSWRLRSLLAALLLCEWHYTMTSLHVVHCTLSSITCYAISPISIAGRCVSHWIIDLAHSDITRWTSVLTQTTQFHVRSFIGSRDMSCSLASVNTICLQILLLYTASCMRLVSFQTRHDQIALHVFQYVMQFRQWFTYSG